MAETRKYSKSGRRNIFNGTSLVAKLGEDTLVCVPLVALEVARGLVKERGYWRTTYAMTYGDTEYTLPNDAELDLITAALDDFLERTNDMDCSDFTNELNDIEQAILTLSGGSGCGCGSGGAGATSPPPDDTDTGDITETTGTPPPGFPDWETYQVAKCDIATMIVNDLLADIVWWQSVTIATLTLGSLSAGMLSILSAFTLTAVLAGLLALLAYNIAFLTNAEDAIESGFEDLLCAIMAGTDSQTSMDNFISEMETQVDLEIADVIARFLVKQLLGQWADTELFNLLYADYDDFLGRQIPTGGNCGACGVGCHNVQVAHGTWLGGETYQSINQGGAQRVKMFFNEDAPVACSGECGPMELVSLEALVGWTDAGAGNDNFRFWTDAACPFTSGNADAYSSDTPPTLGVKYCHRKMEIMSTAQFTVTLGRWGHCF